MRTIGASFSGGGFRAAAFTFGCLDMLHRAQLGPRSLLSNIAFSSSTSGGSIAMAFHAVRAYKGMPFPAILAELRTAITGEQLLAEAMRILQDDTAWKAYPAKTRNLINAFAIVYDQKLFARSRAGLFNTPPVTPHIPRYCFNTTELNHGMSFRFDLSGEERQVTEVGNWYQHFGTDAKAALDHVRLADIAAASSCFPGGFEPLLFPQDFQELPADDPLQHALVDEVGRPLPPGAQPFGLLDGGVVDNQGLYALKVEAGRREARRRAAGEQFLPRDAEPFDLLISCDVSSFYVDAFSPPSAAGAWGRGWSLSAWVAVGLLVLACIVLGWALSACAGAWIAFGALTVPALLAAFGLYRIVKALRPKKGDGSWSVMMNKYGRPLLKRLTPRTLAYMLKARLGSVWLIFNDAFMTQIRRQQYGGIYSGDRAVPVISCMVYELARKNTKTLQRRMATKRARAVYPERWDNAVAPLTPSAALMDVADSAAAMPTTLWFDPHNAEKLDHLLACGRFTMCFNLLVHLAEQEAQRGTLTAEETALRQQLLTAWNAFQRAPN